MPIVTPLLPLLFAVICRAEENFDLGSGKKPIELTDETFEHHTQAATGATTGPWMVMFYAPWCGACRHFAPDFDTLAESYSGEGLPSYAKVDCDGAGAGTCRRFHIRSYPTVKFFMSEKMVQHQGVRSVPMLKQWIDTQMEQISEVGDPVSPPLSWWTEAEFFLELLKEAFWEIYTDYPLLVQVPLLGSAGLTAITIILIMFFGRPQRP